jgi:hypothetical protein
MRKERTVSKLPAKIFRIVLKTIAFVLLFVILLFVLLLTPPVQRFLTTRVQHYLENKLHTKVIIGRISFGLSGKIGLNDIFIADKTSDTLVSGGSLRAHINYLKYFRIPSTTSNLLSMPSLRKAQNHRTQHHRLL